MSKYVDAEKIIEIIEKWQKEDTELNGLYSSSWHFGFNTALDSVQTLLIQLSANELPAIVAENEKE